MCAGGGNAQPVEAVRSVLGLVDSYLIVDSGLDRKVREETEDAASGLQGRIIDRSFDGSGPSFTFALNEARGEADWLLHMHSDERAEVHPLMREWLAEDPSPNDDAWFVPIVNPGLTHQLPRLLRGNEKWEYVGNAHEYLPVHPSRCRQIVGLRLIHNGWSHPSKFEWVIEQLVEGRANGEPRATFYTGEALRDLGRTDEAISVYRDRAAMSGTWEEERWYAEYQAAKLSEDIEWLISVHHQRPHRHEPLTAAARIVAARDNHDFLFNEAI